MTTNIDEKILHGTTTVGIKASDGVVLCADMRASAGYFIANNNTMKIQKIYDHVGLTLAGGVADAQNLTDILRYHANIHAVQKNENILIRSLARLVLLSFIKTEAIRLLPTSCLVAMIKTDRNCLI